MPYLGDVIEVSGRRFLLEDGIGSHGSGAKGGFGVVFASRELDGQGLPMPPLLAIKMVERSQMQQHRQDYHDGDISAEKRFVASLSREGEILAAMTAHHGDLRKVNVIPYRHHGTMRFPDEDRAYPAVIMARAECTLTQVLAARPGTPGHAIKRRLLTREGICDLLAGQARALNALAAMAGTDGKLAHRDYKTRNILYYDRTFVLSDFGNLKSLNGDTVSVGAYTPDFTAPELWKAIRNIQDTGNASLPVSYASADVYSLGMVMLLVLMGSVPVHQAEWNVQSIDERILLPSERARLDNIIRTLPSQGELGEGDTMVPAPRPSGRDLADFQTGLIRLLLDMVRVTPDHRPGAAQVAARTETLHQMLLGRHPTRPRPSAAIAPKAPPRPMTPPPRRLPLAMLAALAIVATGGIAGGWLSTQVWHIPGTAAVISLDTVAPLDLAQPARWSGNHKHFAQPLCGEDGLVGTLMAGERVVVGIRLPSGSQSPTGRLVSGQHWRPAHCSAIDAPQGRWQCIADTAGLNGAARMALTSGATILDVPFAIRPSGTACTQATPNSAPLVHSRT